MHLALKYRNLNLSTLLRHFRPFVDVVTVLFFSPFFFFPSRAGTLPPKSLRTFIIYYFIYYYFHIYYFIYIITHIISHGQYLSRIHIL